MQQNTNKMKSYYEKAAEIKSAKQIFDVINGGFNVDYENGRFTAWDFQSEIVFEFVKECSNGFQADVASKALQYGRLSEKQAWCIAFEFMKLKSDKYASWVEKQKQSIAA